MTISEFSARESIIRLPDYDRPTVLVVEDNRRLRDMLIEQLVEIGIVPTVATSGPEAVRLAGTLRPDLVLLDGLLPGLHGFEVARLIRHLDSHYRPRIAILTGIYTKIQHRSEAKVKHGVDDYLVKPITTAQLANLVATTRKKS